MNRRHFLALATAGAASLLKVDSSLHARTDGPEREDLSSQPNILFIIIDDLNDWVTPFGGHPCARTPNIARLAGTGITFTNAHCPFPGLL